MDFKINADDYGLTKGITDNILDCIDKGKLNSVSLLPNGGSFDYAVAEFKKRSNISLNIHINLVEGKALSCPADLPYLVHENGFFHHTFFSLLMLTLFSRRQKKEQLKKQLELECRAQVSRVLKAFNNDITPGLDSHLHFHMIPFVFDILAGITCKRNMSIRLPREPFFVCLKCFADIKNYLGSNIVKHILLRLLSRYNCRRAEYPCFFSANFFIGVLFTGHITLPSISRALRKIPDNSIVEILFHPGSGNSSEKAWLKENARFADFYFSSCRRKELQILKSAGFIEIISKYERKKNETFFYSG